MKLLCLENATYCDIVWYVTLTLRGSYFLTLLRYETPTLSDAMLSVNVC
jgi:hypothetical protein